MKDINRLIEFDVIIYYSEADREREVEKYLDLGMEPPPHASNTEEIVKYYFDCSDITEIKQTKILYRDNWKDAVVVTFSSRHIMTPPLLCTIEEFKAKVNEHNKKNIEVK